MLVLYGIIFKNRNDQYFLNYWQDLCLSHFVHVNVNERLKVPMEKKSTILSPIHNKLREQILHTISEFDMFRAGDKVLIGVSGGPDSVALLHLLNEMTAELNIELGIGHLDHGLRPSATAEEALFVQGLADALNLACHREKATIDPTCGSLEERARKMRYAFFHRIAETHLYTKIALAHHADDNAETVLMHLLRGSGIRGISGIPPVGKNGIVRPLIGSSRADILAFLKESAHAYRVDATNTDLRFTRNRIRHQLLPMLEKEFNPNITKTLNQAATIYRQEDQWLDHQADEWLPEVQSNSTARGFELNVHGLAKLPTAIQRRLIRNALRTWRGHIRGLTADHVQTLLEMAGPGCRNQRTNLPAGIRVERSASGLVFSHTSNPRKAWDSPPGPTFCYSIASAETIPAQLTLTEADCCLAFSTHRRSNRQTTRPRDPRTIVLDLEQLHFPLTIRNFQPGDCMRPFGLNGTQKIKQLFIDRKIPPRQRKRIPILISDQDVIWVAGLRRGAAAPLSKKTAHILRIEMRPISKIVNP